MMNQTMSQPVVSTEMIDDDELNAELDDLLATRLGSNPSSAPLRPQTTDNIGKHQAYSFIFAFGLVFHRHTFVLLIVSVR